MRLELIMANTFLKQGGVKELDDAQQIFQRILESYVNNPEALMVRCNTCNITDVI